MSGLRLPNGMALESAQPRFVQGGPASAFEAIDQARVMLASPDVAACLVLAIDSLIDARVLAWLDQHYRLKTSAHSDGVIPGEAACLAIVSRRPIASRGVTLLGLRSAPETATVLNEEPMIGKGLATACAPR